MAIDELDFELPVSRGNEDDRPLGGPLQLAVTFGLMALPFLGALFAIS